MRHGARHSIWGRPHGLRYYRTISGSFAVLAMVTGLLIAINPFNPADAAPSIPYKVNFQGRLTNAAGAPVADGLYNLQFRLYDAASAGTQLWTETRETTNRVQVTNGLFSVQLGDVTALSPTLFNSTTPRYFEITMATPATATCSTAACAAWESPMTPRQPLGSAAYAFNADTVDGIDGANLAQLSAANTFSNTNVFQNTLTINGVNSATKFAVQDSGGATVLGVNTTTQTVSVANLVVGAGSSITLVGGASGTRPASPAEGTIYYDSTTKQLLTYANGKWQAHSSASTRIIAAGNSTQSAKDGAHFVADGEAVVGVATVDGDQQQINQAIASLPGTGGTIYLTEGTYYLDGSVLLPSNVRLTGAGDATLLTINNSMGGSFSFIANSDGVLGNTNITIDNLRFDGNRSGTGNGALAINVINLTKVGAATGSDIKGAMIRGNTFRNVRNASIRLNDAYGSTVTDNTISGGAAVSDGIFINIGGYNVISGNNIRDMNKGIYLENGDYNAITSNNLNANGTNAINLKDGSNFNTISGNNLTDTTQVPISLSLSDSNTFDGNTLYMYGGTGSAAGIEFASNADYNSIVNNKIHDTDGTGYAATIGSGSDNNYFSNNTMRGAGANGIFDGAVGTVFAGQLDANGRLINKSIGGALVQTSTNSSMAFTVQDAAGTDILTVDSVSRQVGIGTTPSTAKLSVATGTGVGLRVSQVGAGDVLQLFSGGSAVMTVGANGSTLLRSFTNSTTAFQIQNSDASNTLFNVSTANNNITLGTATTLTLSGGVTGSRPASPTEGMIYFDTTTKQLLTYANGKWKADRSSNTKLVAAINSSQAARDAADFVATATSAQTAINTALTAATGGKVYLIEGTYNVNGSILIPANTTLTGAGDGTVIELADTDAAIDVIRATTENADANITVSDIKLNGRNDLNTAGLQNGIVSNGLVGVRVQSVTAMNFRTSAVYASASRNVDVSGNRFINNSVGVDSLNTTNMVVGDNLFENNGYGVYASGSSYFGNTISGNTIRSSSYGVYLDSNTSRTTITANAMENVDYGIWSSSTSSYHTVSENTITGKTDSRGILLNGNYHAVNGNNLNSHRYGIYLFADNSSISSNVIRNSGEAAHNDAIYVTNGAGNSILGNSITDSSATTTNYAIHVFDSASTGNYIADNTLGSGAVQDNGTATIYSSQLNASGVSVNKSSNGSVFQAGVNSTNTFQVQNAGGTGVLTVDTTNMIVNVTALSSAGSITIGSGSDLKFGGAGNTRGAITKDFACTTSEAINDIIVITGSGAVGRTTTAGDIRVVGVVVAKPTTTQCTVATEGVVQVLWNATSATVGDVVITSTTAGAAATSGTPTAGSIVGKALSVKDGSNLVWILLN